MYLLYMLVTRENIFKIVYRKKGGKGPAPLFVHICEKLNGADREWGTGVIKKIRTQHLQHQHYNDTGSYPVLLSDDVDCVKMCQHVK